MSVLEEDYARAALRHLRTARNKFQTIDVYGYKAPEIYIKEKKRILKDTIFLEKQLDTTLTYLAECRNTVGSQSLLQYLNVPLLANFSGSCFYSGVTDLSSRFNRSKASRSSPRLRRPESSP